MICGILDYLRVLLQEGKNIEAMMCQQAVEKLNEYEGRLTDLKMKMTDSLKWNNIDDVGFFFEIHQLIVLC